MTRGGPQDQSPRNAQRMAPYDAAPLEKRAIDQWMRHALKAQYAQAAEEPIPDELLSLIHSFPRN